jgi:tetratricopeptide (TPR) repeat protein
VSIGKEKENRYQMNQENFVKSKIVTKKCKECDCDIPIKAKKCYKCGSSQSRWGGISTALNLISFIMLCIAIAQVFLGYNQMQEAAKERISAEEALKKAKGAEEISMQLNNVEQVRNLGDLAIIYSSRYHLKKLEKIKEENIKTPIGKNALSEIFRVKAFFLSVTKLAKEPLKVSFLNGISKTLDKCSTDQLIEVLFKNHDWNKRAQAAMLLGSKREVGVPAVLVCAILCDQNLEVIIKASRSLSSITNFESRDVFPQDDIVKNWWIEHNKNVDKGLSERNLTGIEYFMLAQINSSLGLQQQALKNLQKSVILQPDLAEAYNLLAWIYATSKSSSMRNSEKAISNAAKAVALKKDAAYLDTLAAAYAEKGDFNKAIEQQLLAINSLYGDSEQAEDYNKRLKLYQQGKPCRE